MTEAESHMFDGGRGGGREEERRGEERSQRAGNGNNFREKNCRSGGQEVG